MPVRGVQMWQVTARDVDMLQWTAGHGFVTADQIAGRFFSGKRAAYARIRKLIELGLLERRPTFYREPFVLRVTAAGGRVADTELPVANLVLGQIRHDLAVIDLVEDLSASYPGVTVETEREFRHRRYRTGERYQRTGIGRIPDSVLHFPNGATVYLELDLTPKRTREIEKIVNAYTYERVDKVWYYCASPKVTARVRDIVAGQSAADVIDVREWRR